MTLALLAAWLARPGRALGLAALGLVVLVVVAALSGCVSVTATSEQVQVRAVGDVYVAAGCPATATGSHGGQAGAGASGVDAGSPCVAVRGAGISSNLGTALGTIGGTLAGWLLR